MAHMDFKIFLALTPTAEGRPGGGWVGHLQTFPEGCSIPQLLGGVQREKLEWDPSLLCFINCHGEKLGKRRLREDRNGTQQEVERLADGFGRVPSTICLAHPWAPALRRGRKGSEFPTPDEDHMGPTLYCGRDRGTARLTGPRFLP